MRINAFASILITQVRFLGGCPRIGAVARESRKGFSTVGSLFLGSLLATCILLLTVPVWADHLNNPPTRWNSRLQPLPNPDISGAEPAAREAMNEARAATEKALMDSTIDAKQLAWEYGNLGNLYQLYNINRLADSCYDNARAVEPNNFRWIYYDAYLSLILGRSKQAIEDFNQALALETNYPPIQLHMGHAWYDLGEFDKAERTLKTAVDNPGLRPTALYYLGQIALLNKRFKDAIDRFEEVLRLDPDASKVHYPLASAYRAVGNAEQTRRHLALRGERMPQIEDQLIAELNRLNTGGRPFFISALQAVQKRDYNSANLSFRQGLERDPTNNNARLSLARSLFLAGEPDQAAKELDKVLDQRPNNSLALFLKGTTLDLNGEIDKAVAHYKQVIKIDKKHAGAHFFLANRLMLSSNYAEAATHYSAAIAADAGNPLARLFNLVARYRSGEDAQKIIEKLEQEIGRQPDPQMYQYALVRLLATSENAQVRDPARALELSKMLAIQQGIPPYLELLAIAYAANGEFEQAAALQQQLVASLQWMPPGPDHTRLQNTLDSYRQGNLPPSRPWPEDDLILTPPPIDAVAVFLEYPAPLSY